MATEILYAEDRVAPATPVPIDIRAIEERALGIIRAAVPRGGQPKYYDDLCKIVQADPQCYVLFVDRIIQLIEQVKAERPVISQAVYAEDIAGHIAVEGEAIEGK